LLVVLNIWRTSEHIHSLKRGRLGHQLPYLVASILTGKKRELGEGADLHVTPILEDLFQFKTRIQAFHLYYPVHFYKGSHSGHTMLNTLFNEACAPP
jgi:hypothetical protein